MFGGGYSEFSLAMCAVGIFLLVCMWENKFNGEDLTKINMFMYKLRAFSSICYFTHLMVYTLICIFVWNEFKSGLDTFITVVISVFMIFIVFDIICTVKRRKNETKENSKSLY